MLRVVHRVGCAHADLGDDRVGHDAEEMLGLALAIGVGDRLQAVGADRNDVAVFAPEVISFAIALAVAMSFSALKWST